jgi:uncharacterized protein YprB with RNaseH-like and TPR domain
MAKPRVIAWDIEATNLNADWGYIICIGWKVVGEKKTNLLKITDYDLYKKDPTNDKFLVAEASKILSEADVWTTWYGGGYDVPYVQSRLLKHKLPPMPPVPHVDGWKVARYKMKLSSNRLASVTGFLDLEDKTPVKSGIWAKAQAGDQKALGYIYKHCIQDVIVLEQVYNRIKALTTTHPNVNLANGKLNACPICGAVDTLVKRGYNLARTSKAQRYQCKGCGGWSHGKPIKTKGMEIR